MADEDKDNDCTEELTPKSIASDGGILSRKLHLTIFAMLLIVGLGIVCHWSLNIGAQMQTLVTGLLGALAIFVGGNVANKFTAANLMKVMIPVKSMMAERAGEHKEDRAERADIRQGVVDAKAVKDARADAKNGPPIENG
jgi:hypothetical protein